MDITIYYFGISALPSLELSFHKQADRLYSHPSLSSPVKSFLWSCDQLQPY